MYTIERTYYFTLALIVSVLFAFTGTALAQETNLEVETRVDASVNVQNPDTTPRPLQMLKAKTVELRKETRDAMQDVTTERKELRVETRMELKNATTGAERRNVIKDTRDDRQDLRGEVRDIRSTFRDRLQALLRTHVGTAVKRLNAALEHFNNIVARIESRIDKLKEGGVATASVEASLSISVSLLATAKTDAQALVDLINSVTDASDADTVKADIRASFEKAKESVKAAHRGLLSTAQMLAELVRVSGSADASAETEIQ